MRRISSSFHILVFGTMTRGFSNIVLEDFFIVEEDDIGSAAIYMLSIYLSFHLFIYLSIYLPIYQGVAEVTSLILDIRIGDQLPLVIILLKQILKILYNCLVWHRKKSWSKTTLQPSKIICFG